MKSHPKSVAGRFWSVREELPVALRWSVPVRLGRIDGLACTSIAETQEKHRPEGQGEVRERPNRTHC